MRSRTPANPTSSVEMRGWLATGLAIGVGVSVLAGSAVSGAARRVRDVVSAAAVGAAAGRRATSGTSTTTSNNSLAKTPQTPPDRSLLASSTVVAGPYPWGTRGRGAYGRGSSG